MAHILLLGIIRTIKLYTLPLSILYTATWDDKEYIYMVRYMIHVHVHLHGRASPCDRDKQTITARIMAEYLLVGNILATSDSFITKYKYNIISIILCTSTATWDDKECAYITCAVFTYDKGQVTRNI